jgi:hypothetical protein
VSDTTVDGGEAGDVLDSLVKQFTDPLACLRELIQNAVDAGSDTVEVNFGREGELGILEVKDHGEGMDKAVIESKLVRLFSSSKDGDLTKIGKFGIGFVSVFALDPVAVCVDTAKAGERWRVVFHADRTWTRAALHEPLEGTRVRMFIKRSPAAWQALTRDAEAAVRKWCRYLQAEIIVDGTTINEPLSLAHCQVTATRDDREGTVIIVGVGGAPQVGFYNKGLTLLEAPSWSDFPPGVSVRVSSRWLEHTLTRDSVVKDAHYHKALALVLAVITEDLEPRCIDAMTGLPLDQRSAVLDWLAGRTTRSLARQRLLVDVTGVARAPADLTAPVFVTATGSPSSARVAAAVAAAGHVVLPLSANAVAHDRAAMAQLMGKAATELADVEEAWVAAMPVDAARRPRVERLIEATSKLLAAGGIPTAVTAGVVIGRQCRSRLAWRLPAPKGASVAASVAAALPVPTIEAPTRRPMIVIDVDHGDFEPVLALAATDTGLAALLLSRLILPMPISHEHNVALAIANWRGRDDGQPA